MKTSIRLIIKDDHVKRDGTAPLYLQVFVEGKMIRFPLELSWSAAHFSKASSKLLARHKGDAQLDDYQLIIRAKEAQLNEIFTHYRLAKKTLTVELLRKEFYNESGRDDFYAFWKKEMDDRLRRRKIEQASWVCHSASLSKLKQYKPTCAYQELTPKLLENFRAWMISKLGNAPATREKTLKDVRTYVRLALASGVVFDDPFKVVKVKHIETVPDVLTLEQVKQLLDLYNRPNLKPAWHCVLQHFLFSCFTGLRISDIMRVTDAHIIDGALVFEAHKTRNSHRPAITIPLHELALSFITNQQGKLFTTFTDQYARRMLKEIASELNWTIKKFGTHTARHTFGTNFIELGGDVVTLKEYMGHKKIQTTMQYVHISNKRKREQIKVFDYFK